jgi:hypothetical protein
MLTDEMRNSILLSGAQGEKKVFALLAPLQEKGYILLHNVYRIHVEEEQKEGEADLIILGPCGYMVFEIKSGRHLACDDQGFYDEGNEGVKRRFDPFKQAMSGAAWLDDRIKGYFAGRFVNRGFGVIFTHYSLKTKNHQAQSFGKVVIDAKTLRKGSAALCQTVEDLFELWQRSDFHLIAPHEWKSFVMQELTPRFDLESIAHIEQELAASQADLQMHAVSRVGPSVVAQAPLNRVLYLGGPGTGKTLILMEQARRLAAKGLKGLYVCYNKLLCNRTRHDFKQQAIAVPVVTIEDLQYWVIAGYNKAFSMQLKKDSTQLEGSEAGEFFNRILPEHAWRYAQNFLENTVGACDFMIIDEAQDLHQPLWWKLLGALTNREVQVQWFVAADPVQRIHHLEEYEPRVILEQLQAMLPVKLDVWNLHWNFRNSPQVFHALVKEGCAATNFWSMHCAYEVQHPNSSTREKSNTKAIAELPFIKISKVKTLQKAMGKAIDDLKSIYHLEHSDVVVLGMHRFSNSIFKDHLLEDGLFHFGKLTLGPENNENPLHAGSIRYYTIHRFKGLEAKGVVLVDFDHHTNDGEYLFRISLSRASIAALEIRD